MSDFKIVNRALGNVVEIEASAPTWKMAKVMQHHYAVLNDFICGLKAEVTVPPYAFYPDVDWDEQNSGSALRKFLEVFTKTWRFNAGIGIDKRYEGDELIQSNHYDEKRYVRTLHKGPYSKLSQSYAALYHWAKAEGIALKGEAFEIYINDPHEVASKDLETEILVPIV